MKKTGERLIEAWRAKLLKLEEETKEVIKDGYVVAGSQVIPHSVAAFEAMELREEMLNFVKSNKDLDFEVLKEISGIYNWSLCFPLESEVNIFDALGKFVRREKNEDLKRHLEIEKAFEPYLEKVEEWERVENLNFEIKLDKFTENMTKVRELDDDLANDVYLTIQLKGYEDETTKKIRALVEDFEGFEDSEETEKFLEELKKLGTWVPDISEPVKRV